MAIHTSAPQFDASSRLKAQDLGTPASFVEGIAYDSNGRVCTTTSTAGTDVFVAGIRVSAAGRVVVSSGAVVAAANGLAFDANGALVRQVDAAILGTDTFTQGLLASSTLGVQVTVL